MAAAPMTFGEILQQARERKGMDLATAARRLRIRPDILRAIEGNDFSRMPPRGYTRNMVNAYARLVGLNPTDITRMYLDEAYAYQVGRARQEAQPANFDMGGSSRRQGRSRERSSQQQARPDGGQRQGSFGRTLYTDDRNESFRSGQGSQPRLYSEDRTHPSHRTALPNGQYTNFYAGPSAPGGVRSKLPFIIAGAVILVLLIVVLALVFGGRAAESTDVPNVRVTGLTDPEASSTDEGTDTQAQTQTPVAVAPTAAVVSYEVASGQSAYIEVYLDGGSASVADTVDGPATETYDVTGTLRFVTTNPEGVTLTVDGAAVAPVDNNGTGVYSYTVDFPAILEQWKAANPTAGTSTSSSGTAASSGSEASSGTATSTS